MSKRKTWKEIIIKEELYTLPLELIEIVQNELFEKIEVFIKNYKKL